jgi:nitrogen fixation-related uncharacterized protein
MFTRFWIAYTILGLALAVAIFAWAVRTRQFEESRRAGLLPFDDAEPDSTVERPERREGRFHLYLLSGLVVVGVVLTIVMVVMATAGN